MSFNDRLPIKSISGWTPYVVLLVAGVVLWLKLDSFPESWPVHWNARGEADQWATKTPLGILFPIIVGAVLCVLFELIKALVASATIRRSKERMRLEVAEALAEMNRDLLTIMQTATATIFALLAVLLPAGAQVNARWFVVTVLTVMALAVVFGLSRWLRSLRVLRRSGKLPATAGWNGLIYSDESDDRLWVPKIAGPGYTLNFAKPAAWLIMAGILLFVVAVLIIVFASIK